MWAHAPEDGKERPLYTDEVGGFKTDAVCRWSPTAGTYVGPQGGRDQPFLRVNDVDEFWEFFKELSQRG